MINKYLTISSDVTTEIVEKKSKFIAHVFPVDSEEDAFLKLDNVKKENRDARHNVFSYRIANGPERASDDGEPSRHCWRTYIGYIKRYESSKCISSGN